MPDTQLYVPPSTLDDPTLPPDRWPAPREDDPALRSTGGLQWMAGLSVPQGGERCLDRRLGESRRHRIATEGVICERRSGETRRKQVRILVKFMAEARMGNVETFGTVLDISVGGLFFHTTTPFGAGERVSLEFRIPDTNELIRCIGEVVAVVRGGGRQGPVGNCFKFVVLRPGHRSAIEGHILRKLEEEMVEVVEPGALVRDDFEEEVSLLEGPSVLDQGRK